MNEKIVKNAINNFTGKYKNLNSDILKESLERLLWKSIRQMRNEDPFLYEEIRDLSTLNQTKLLEQRIEMEFLDIDELTEDISNALIRSFSKAVEINECLGDEYVEEYYQTLMNDTFQFLMEDENLLKKLKNWGIEKVKNTVKNIARSVPALSVIGGTYLAGGVIGTGLVGTLTMFAFLLLCVGVADYLLTDRGVNLQKEQMIAIKSITDTFYSLAKVVKNGTEKVKHMYNLTYVNEQKCYQKAGVDPIKLGFIHMLAMKEDGWWNKLLLGTENIKLDVLKRCYLENFLDRIAIFFELYFDCLKKTGDWNQVRSMPDDKFIQMFRIKGGFYPACDQFRDNAVKALKSFEDLVDYVYSKAPEKKSQWMLLLNRYLLDMKASQDNLKKEFNDKQSKNHSFTSDKYRRLGKDTDSNDNYHKNRI